MAYEFLVILVLAPRAVVHLLAVVERPAQPLAKLVLRRAPSIRGRNSSENNEQECEDLHLLRLLQPGEAREQECGNTQVNLWRGPR